MSPTSPRKAEQRVGEARNTEKKQFNFEIMPERTKVNSDHMGSLKKRDQKHERKSQQSFDNKLFRIERMSSRQ